MYKQGVVHCNVVALIYLKEFQSIEHNSHEMLLPDLALHVFLHSSTEVSMNEVFLRAINYILRVQQIALKARTCINN